MLAVLQISLICKESFILHIDIPISDPVYFHRSYKLNFSTVHELSNIGEDPNVYMSELLVLNIVLVNNFPSLGILLGQSSISLLFSIPNCHGICPYPPPPNSCKMSIFFQLPEKGTYFFPFF